jgi:hypothetical protein
VTSAAEGQRLPDTEDWWPDATSGPWVLTLAWQVIDGRPECVGMSLEHTADPSAPPVLTAATLKELRIAEKIAMARAQMAPAVEATRGLRASTANRLREAAAIYLVAYDRGEPPTKAVATHFGITTGGASNLVSRARSVGLLPPTSRGVAVGAREKEFAAIRAMPPGPHRDAALASLRRRWEGIPEPEPD